MNTLRPTVVVISSGKGGVGKTLLAICIATIMKEERKVLLVDMDLSVKGLTFLFGTAEEWQVKSGSMIDFLSDKISARDVLQYVSEHPQMPIAPASTDFKVEVDWDKLLGQTKSYESKMKEFIDAAHEEGYDFIIFDTRAGIDGLLISLTQHCDVLIVVVEADEISLLSSLDMRGQLKESAKRMHFVVNKSPKASLGRIDPILQRLSFVPPLPFDMKMYKKFVNNARGLVSSKFRRTSYRRYVGRLVKNLFGIQNSPQPNFLDHMMNNAVSRLIANLFIYGVSFIFIITGVSFAVTILNHYIEY